MKSILKFAAICAVLAGLGWGGWIGYNRYQKTEQTTLPVIKARQGEFVVIIPCRGEIKADRSAQIYAPFVPNLRISWLAAAGERVEQGEPVVRFDSSTSAQDLIQKEAALRQAQATLDQQLGQSQITLEHDQADVQDAKYQVELAQIKTATNEFVPRLEAERNKIDLTVAEQKRKVQDATVAQHKASDEAKLASLRRQRDLAQADLELTKSRASKMEVAAPLSGFFIVATNYSNSGLSNNGSPFKVGDTVTAGTSLAVIPDMSSLIVDVKVEEIDRGRMKTGDSVRIRIDALPELNLMAKLTQISPLAELSLEGAAGRNFRGYAALVQPDQRLRPGMNAGMDVIIQKIPEAIAIPSRALFTRDGKPVVFVAENNTYQVKNVEVLARNPDEVAISGIPGNSLVSLVDPGAKGAANDKTSKDVSTK